MATTIATLRASAKRQLGIKSTDTTFDSDLDENAAYAIKMLSPIVLNEIASDVTKTVNTDGRTIDLPSGTRQVRSGGLELYSADVADYCNFSDFKQHGTKIVLDYYVTPGTAVRIWGLGDFNVTATDLPIELELVIVYWVMSMFYNKLAGDKRKYNIYVGTTGAAADHDMKDSATYWKQEGNELLVDRANIRGS
jgi:hypothetical protein